MCDHDYCAILGQISLSVLFWEFSKSCAPKAALQKLHSSKILFFSAHENYLLEESEFGYWLNLLCADKSVQKNLNFWRKSSGSWATEKFGKCPHRFGQNNNKVTASIVGFAPYTIYNENRTNVKGTDKEILEILAYHMGFKIGKFHLENTWGKPYQNGSWDGLLGNVSEKRILFNLGI